MNKLNEIAKTFLWLMSVCLLVLPCRTAAGGSLAKAYREEMELLKMELSQLRARKMELEEKTSKENQVLRDEVAKLSEDVTRLQIENQALEERVDQGEDVVQVGGDRQALLDNTLDQAITTLRRFGIRIEEAGGDPRPVIREVFKGACDLADRLGGIRVEKSSYFGRDGSKREADVLLISQVAAVSLDKVSGGALGPAGGGALKVLRPEAAEQAMAFVQGKCPSMVSAYLFDPTEKAEDQVHKGRTLWETFLAGGFVMWPILGLAVIAFLILLERLAVLRKAHTNTRRLMEEVGGYIGKGELGKAAEACHKKPGAVARVLEAVLRNKDLPRSQLEEVVNEAILAERPTLERFLPALNVIAAVAPLLGLLGTVTGMIGTFMVITEHGTGDPRLLSRGISEALLTTEFGLIVAIPTLLIHALLSSRVDHVLSDMDINALKLLNRLDRKNADPEPEDEAKKQAAGNENG